MKVPMTKTADLEGKDGYRGSRFVPTPEEAARNPAGGPVWVLHLPGWAIWNHYFLSGVRLADMPGVPPAVLAFPGATHEIQVGAIDQDTPAKDLAVGRFQILTPINHVLQLAGFSDAGWEYVMDRLAADLIQRRQVPEPEGIAGARRLFRDRAEWLLKQLEPEFRPGEWRVEDTGEVRYRPGDPPAPRPSGDVQ